MKSPRYHACAFTLIELMTVISMISVLSALSLGSVSGAKRRVHRTACLNNLRQLGLASLVYAGDDKRGTYADTVTDGDDNQNWLYPNYIKTLNTFRCPATRYSVRPNVQWVNPRTGATELADLARYGADTRPFGTSYEIFGFMHFNGSETTALTVNGTVTNTPGIQKTESTVSSYVHQNSELGLRGVAPGPSRIWLFVDADPSAGNYPGKLSNHRSGGLNVEFCDGHVEWITQSTWLRSYELSQDEGTRGH